MIFSFLPFQIILILFLLFAFSRVILRFREGSVGPGAFLFWSGIWILALMGVIEPGFTTFVAEKVGVGRGVDAVLYFSILLLFYLIYRTNIHLENTRHEITELARRIALSNRNSKNKKNN